MAIDLTSLAKQIADLNDAQACALLSSIEGLTARVVAYKANVVAAEAQRDAWAAKLTCPDCGEPATVARSVMWEQFLIRPGIENRSSCPLGGILGHDSNPADPPSDDAGVRTVTDDLWVSCTKTGCGWRRVSGGRAAIVGWE